MRAQTDRTETEGACEERGETKTFREFVRHISTCTKRECREVLRNHIELCEHFGVEFHPPQ
jgi:hypothetical protein